MKTIGFLIRAIKDGERFPNIQIAESVVELVVNKMNNYIKP